MKSDVALAGEAVLLSSEEIGKKIGLEPEDLIPYGRTMAKISNEAVSRGMNASAGKLVLVTAMNPTPYGEGKTTVNIGLSMALNRLGKKTITALREPSLGPVFGIKGGAAGGGYSQVLPMENINLHFTGDFHAITSAHNLISAAIDNEIHQGNALDIDARQVTWKRVLDMNDRALRHVVVGMGGKVNGFPREDGFDITVASEIMAILCLSRDLADLKERVGNIIIGKSRQGKDITVKDLKVQGAVSMLLKEAMLPNLVQTMENTPAIIHGGPFANIAHGCNSVRATKTALGLSEYTVTEAGFGADLGAEKFLDIKCPAAGISPDAVVVVATLRAIKHHGQEEGKEGIRKGVSNLLRHLENLGKYGLPTVVAINRFPDDTSEELEFLQSLLPVDGVVTEVFAKGSEGALELGKKVIELCETPSDFHRIYNAEDPLTVKIEKVAKEIYRAQGVDYSPAARKALEEMEAAGKGHLPICVAKTQYSFSDDPKLLGAPEDFRLHVEEAVLQNGAGFVVIKTGKIMTMPGLPKVPAAYNMDIDEAGNITGLF